MKHKILLKKLKKNGWNMQFDAREQALIKDIAEITEKESIPIEPPVMQKATVIWMTFDEYGDLEKEFIYPETEDNKMPYACEKYLMYNKNKTAKRLSCFSA